MKRLRAFEAGKRLGVSIFTIRRMLRQGTLRGAKFGAGPSSFWWIDEQSVAELEERVRTGVGHEA